MDNEFVEPKSNKGLYAVIVFLILIVIGLGGYLVYDNFIKNDKEDNSLVSEDNDDSIVKINKGESNISFDEISNLILFYLISDYPDDNLLPSNFLSDFKKYSYDKLISTISSFSLESISCSDAGIENEVYTSGIHEGEKICNTSVEFYAYDYLNGLYHNLFGLNNDLPKTYISGTCGGLKYIPLKNGYILDSTKCGFTYGEKYSYKVLDYKIDEDLLKVNVSFKFLDSDSSNENSSANYVFKFKKDTLNYYLYNVEENK